MKYLSIGETVVLLGVAVSTMRRWGREARLAPAFRPAGGHRRYAIAVIQQLAGCEPASSKTLCYARVSSHDQKADLERQGERPMLWCRDHGLSNVRLISNLGASSTTVKMACVSCSG
jgi:predicted site-specific integrase-resolvase